MFWDEEISETEKKQAALDKELKTLLDSLMRDYFEETNIFDMYEKIKAGEYTK